MHPLTAAARLLSEGPAPGAVVRAAREDAGPVVLQGASGISAATCLVLAARELRRPAWIVTPDVRTARAFERDLAALSRRAVPAAVEPLVLPPLEGDPYAFVPPHDHVRRERVATFEALASDPGAATRVVVTPARALLLPCPAPGRAASPAAELSVGRELPPEDLVEQLVRAGYVATDMVSSWGEFARRGAVLDVFPPDADSPVRVEYWGDEITELRTFDPETQRSTGSLESLVAGAVHEAAPEGRVALRLAEWVRSRIRFDMAPAPLERMLAALEDEGTFPGFEVLRWAVDEGVPLGRHLDGALVACVSPELVERELERAHEQLDEELPDELRPFLPGPADLLRPVDEVVAEVVRGGHVLLPDVAWAEPDEGRLVDAGCRPAARHGGDVGRFLQELRQHLDRGGSAGLVMASEGRLERMREVLIEVGLGDRLAWSEDTAGARELDEVPEGHVLLGRGLIGAGARVGSFLVQSEEDVFGDVPAPRRQRPRPRSAAFAQDLRDLKTGDLVVHADHGVGKFEGIQQLDGGPSGREFMVVSYREGDKLYVPLERLDLVEKYSGVAGFSPKLDRLGGATWEKVRRSVKRAMLDMTRELLDLYASRRTARGFRFSEDGTWQREFEAAFPHEETEDQLRAIGDVKDDMQSEAPMDRLVVGDVGFGKTEVALRAAFKAVMDGKQVAVLAPTTVLALQHHATFSRRCQAWPVRVELLSRFRTPKQAKQTLARLAGGECDILVGTHRVLSKDVRFKDLGLLVVDEEQRFGVRHKERIKQLRKEVDVLTLTATPIPRTLSMALGGLRDMSVIETPPANRHAIATHVLPFSTDVVTAAIRQELDRGGQVYFVHDRVQSIYSMAGLVRKLVPGARVGVAHGQLPERELETAMIEFLRGEIDVLTCTTVIENGLDIPRANTLLVNRADRHGLAQLYQLRGRVGRAERQAHAYLFVPDKRQLTPEARRRLAALQEFTELGSGFRIAALDLEIRGAGNLLGGEQHGHIAAVGFDMYVRLLEETVRELQGREAEAGFRASVTLPLDVRIAADHVPDENQRLAIYKKFATVRETAELDQLVADVRDRHGPGSPAIDRLAEHARVRLMAERLRVESVDSDGRVVRLKFAGVTRVRPEALMRLLGEREGAIFTPDGVLRVPAAEGEGPAEAARHLLAELG